MGSDEDMASVAESGSTALPKSESACQSEWLSWGEVAEPNSRIIALYADGSGACVYFHWKDGILYDGEDGCEYQWDEREDFGRWTYLPAGYRLWVEVCSDDPMTFPPSPAPPPQGVNATGAEAFPDNHLNEGD